MSKLSDYELIKNIKNNGDCYSFEELVTRHEKLYYSVVQKFHFKNPESNLQDLLDDLFIVFNNVIDKYDINRNTKFTTFLYYHTKFHCLNSYKKVKQEISHENKDIDLINEKNEKYLTFSENLNEINGIIFDKLNKLKDKRISYIFRRRFIDIERNKLTPWSIISKEIGLSVTGVINKYTLGLKYLNKILYKDKDKII